MTVQYNNQVVFVKWHISTENENKMTNEPIVSHRWCPSDWLYEQRYKQAIEGFTVEQMGRRRRDEYTESAPRLPKQG